MDAVWNGIFAIGGTVLGGVFTLLATRIGTDWSRAKETINDLSDQVIAYWNLEKEYQAEMSALDPQKRSEKTIMEDMRARVQGRGYERPTMTENEVLHIKKKWR